MSTFTATYSPDDNKLRIRADERLSPELYARVKEAGYKWAPQQKLFVAPMWTPAREDIALELAGDIGDEDTSLVDRAEQRAERFEEYSEKRADDSERMADHAESLAADHSPIVNQRSERKARKQADAITAATDKAVKLWETAEYWERRAQGALAHASYKELPGVRARRIKGIEADKRKAEKGLNFSATFLKLWDTWQSISYKDGATITDSTRASFLIMKEEQAHGYASACFTLAKFPREPNETRSNMYEGAISYASALELEIVTPEWLRNARMSRHRSYVAHYTRWIAHYNNRLTYEKAMLNEQGASNLLDKAPRTAKQTAQLLNYRVPGGSFTVPSQWHRGEMETFRQVDMTKAEYMAIYEDRRGTRLTLDKSHKFRIAVFGADQKYERVAVFLTDSKTHPTPASATPPAAVGSQAQAAE